MALAIAFTVYQTAYADIASTLAAKPGLSALAQSAQVLNSQKMAVLEADQESLTGRGGAILIEDGDTLVPNEGPLGAAGTAFAPDNDQISVYVVKEGDVLSEIAAMFGVSVNTIMWANDIKKTTAIAEGDVLVILPISGVRHTVKKGDTFGKIANLYNADAGEVESYNGLDEDATLATGQEIIVPHGEIPAPKPTKRSSSGSGGKTGSNLPAYSGYYIRPLSGGTKTQGIHGNNGVDIAASVGTPLYAAAGGTVIIARTGGWNGGYGNYVVVKHDNGTQTLYGHMNTVGVASGQTVSQGQAIGTLGNSGNSTGPHVHFEIRGARNPFKKSTRTPSCTSSSQARRRFISMHNLVCGSR